MASSMSSVEWSEEKRRNDITSKALDSSNADDPELNDGAGAFIPLVSSPFPSSTGTSDEVPWDDRPLKLASDFSELGMMKERFAKLLLGEDMSGGGRGVCTALAISNAITNLSVAASVFGALWKLEPLAPEKKAMWFREMEWLLSVTDSIVEFAPTVQQFPGGGTYEVMATRQRSDLYVNLPALKKLDALLISILDDFKDTEFLYENRGMVVDANNCSSGMSCEKPSVRQEGKWWIPWPKVPEKGLSKDSRKILQQCRDCGNQILKAAVAINSNVLAEMSIPATYLATLPKSGRDCLGDTIYECIAADQFEPGCFLDSLNLSSEHQLLDLTNKLEATLHVLKVNQIKKYPDIQKSKLMSWGGKGKSLFDGEKCLADHTETLLQYLRLRFPVLPQTALDMSKIQYNKDVGHAILESYSRVMESVAFNIIARIDDVLYVDDAAKCGGATADQLSILNCGGGGGGFNSISSGLPVVQKKISPSPFSIQQPSPCTCSSPLDTDTAAHELLVHNHHHLPQALFPHF